MTVAKDQAIQTCGRGLISTRIQLLRVSKERSREQKKYKWNESLHLICRGKLEEAADCKMKVRAAPLTKTTANKSRAEKSFGDDAESYIM
jgi:hypothetical protein